MHETSYRFSIRDVHVRQTRNQIKRRNLSIIHIALHFFVPAIIAALFFRRDWKLVYLVMVSTMLVDIDHLLVNPVYDPGRCSIGYHPLHGFIPIALYVLLCFFPKSRFVGIGLVVHMVLDSIDCQVTNGVWYV